MVNNMNKDKLIQILLEHPQIHLGGSRYFNKLDPELIKITDDTDWDFYCEDDYEIEKFLEDHGFEEVYNFHNDDWENTKILTNYSNKLTELCEEDGYTIHKGDDLLISIFKHPKYHIDVLTRSNVDKYKAVINKITPAVFYQYLGSLAHINVKEK